MDLRQKLYKIIFEANTRAGRVFDVLLIICILLSVLVVMIDSVEHLTPWEDEALYGLEWFFTILFTIEYSLRLYCSPNPTGYAKSFYGIIDLLAIVPTYLSLLFPGTQFLLVIRVLRVLRIFRVLKVVQYIKEANFLISALYDSRRKILLFLFGVLTLVVVMGSFMHLIEGEVNRGFNNIPKSIYWAIVTMTTVGYGDISPITPLGQSLAAIIMILGYSIIAVPTGIVSYAMSRQTQSRHRVCADCHAENHDNDAVYCKYCAHKL